MKQIILLRHAQCHGNGYVGGQSDVALNTEGIQRASQIPALLEEVQIDRIFCSPMKRARQTITPFIDMNQHIPIDYDRRLREIDFGIFEGMTYDQIQATYPQQQKAWFSDQLGTAPQNGETLTELHKRVHSFIDEQLLYATEENTILLCGHGGSLRAITCELLRLGPDKHWSFHIQRGNFAIVHIYPDNSAILQRLNTKSPLDT